MNSETRLQIAIFLLGCLAGFMFGKPYQAQADFGVACAAYGARHGVPTHVHAGECYANESGALRTVDAYR